MSFFRDSEAFEVIEKEVIPQLVDQKPAGELLKFGYYRALPVKKHIPWQFLLGNI